MPVKERFISYVQIDTQSDPETGTHPSTAKQFDLARKLEAELKALGASSVRCDKHCYVYAEIPANAEGSFAPLYSPTWTPNPYVWAKRQPDVRALSGRRHRPRQRKGHFRKRISRFEKLHRTGTHRYGRDDPARRRRQSGCGGNYGGRRANSGESLPSDTEKSESPLPPTKKSEKALPSST